MDSKVEEMGNSKQPGSPVCELISTRKSAWSQKAGHWVISASLGKQLRW